ncbi:MAG: hypothetical protein WD557_00285 [Dehalococcoidia bacterium]
MRAKRRLAASFARPGFVAGEAAERWLTAGKRPGLQKHAAGAGEERLSMAAA